MPWRRFLLHLPLQLVDLAAPLLGVVFLRERALRRIAELKRQGSRTLSDFAAAQQADGEMEQLRMRVPGYVRHLEAAEAAKKKTAQPDGGKDGSSSD